MKLHKSQFLVCAALALTIVAPVPANAQGGGAARPPQGGQGGGQRMGGRGMSGLGMLMMPEVQKELKITTAQKSSIEKTMQSMMPRPPQGGQGGSGQRPPQGGQGGQRIDFGAMEKKVTAGFSAAQKARFEELKVQQAGPNAFRRDEVAKKLGLNDKQKKAIEASLEKARPNFNRQGGGQGGQQMDFEKLRKEMDAKRATAMKEIMAQLTPAQKTTWGKMTGKPFTFPRMQFRMGGGGAGRPGGGGSGGRAGGGSTPR